MSNPQTKRIGFVGVGRMGTPMACRLLDAGYELVIFDTNKDALQALEARGAKSAASPKAVADETAIVLISLPMPDIVAAVATGPDGLIHGSAVKIVIDLSTTGPRTATDIAGKLAQQGINVIDCPVSGGIAGAAKGTLALMAAGEPAIYEQVTPILSHLGKLFYVGQGAGMGQTMKVINNLISVTALTITSELMVMGTKAGLDPDAMLEVINAGSGRTNASSDKVPKHILTRTFDFGFAIGLSAKDGRLCVEAGDALGVPLNIGRAVVDLVTAARDTYGDQADMTEIIRLIEDRAGVQVRGKAAKA